VLGERPTTATGHAAVDAYLWIERPGYSNGSCNGGPAKAGAWWRAKALAMAKGAHW
jgi:endoglucanase